MTIVVLLVIALSICLFAETASVAVAAPKLTSEFQNRSFWIPGKPQTAQQWVACKAAATGTPRGAMLADYRGGIDHHLSLYWNDYRKYYVCDYHWGERVVLVRDADFASALRQAIAAFDRMNPSSSLTVYPRDDADTLIAEANPRLQTHSQDIVNTHYHSWFDAIEKECRDLWYQATGRRW